MSRTAAGRAGAIVLAAMLGALLALSAAKIAALGLCCADDGYFATISKNLAMGPGYGSTVYAEGFRPFHPEIGMGPAVILPVAAATWLLGNRYWVPGAATVALWALLLVLVHRRARGAPEVRSPGLAGATFLAGVVLLFPYHFEHWFTMLGEVPTALYLLLGVVVLGRAELSRRSVAAGALLCSFAFLTKSVSAIYCASAFLALLVRARIAERRSFAEVRGLALAAAAAFVAPVLLFELYKLAALGGPRPWGRNFADTVRFVLSQGAPGAGAVAGRWARALSFDRAFYARFGVRASLVALAGLAAAAFLFRSGGGRLHRTVALAIGSGVLLSAIWYLFFSIGWPRYFIVTLLLAWALVCLAVATLRPGLAAAAGAVLLLALLAVNREKLPYLGTGLEGGLFARSPALGNALALTRFVDAERAAEGGRAVFANQWWATTSDLEYYSRSTDVFRRYTLVNGPGEFWLVFNRRFRSEPDEAFDRLVAGCAPSERSYEPYALLRCRR